MKLRHHSHGSLGGWPAVAWCARGQAEFTHERQQSYRTVQRRLAPLRTNGAERQGQGRWPVVARSAEDLSELAGGDTIRREKILIYYTRDFPN
jgi:hypothetical protein